MHSVIYQISDRPISKKEYVTIEHVGLGNMVYMDYTCQCEEEERRMEILNLVEHALPKGMFELNQDGETLTYKGGFREWRKSYTDGIHKRAENINEEKVMEWMGTAYLLQKFIVNPFGTNRLFITEFDGTYGTAEYSRGFMTLVGKLPIGAQLYIGAVIGYRF